MLKTANNTIINSAPISVDIKGLMTMCNVGRHTAETIGAESGAVIRIGKRKLYNVEKVKDYLNELAK